MVTLGKLCRVIVDVSVVTSPEAGHGVDVGLGQHPGERVGIERFADARDLLAGMEIQMDLAKRQNNRVLVRLLRISERGQGNRWNPSGQHDARGHRQSSLDHITSEDACSKPDL